EDRAVDILQSACQRLPGNVEGYKKNDPPAKIAARFAELVEASGKRTWQPKNRRVPDFVGASSAISFALRGGRLWIDAARWNTAKGLTISNAFGLLREEGGRPALAVTESEL